jgi:fermentation-respiration switch protein FrsA (DUF1100 family)
MSEHLDILTSICGQKITTVEEWEQFRRPELIHLLEEYVYGVRPSTENAKVEFKVFRREKNWRNSGATFKEIEVTINDSHTFPFYVFTPDNAKLPVPAFVAVMNDKRVLAYIFYEQVDYPHLPVTEIINRGYGLAVMPTNSVSPDWYFKGEFKRGVFKAIQPNVNERKSNSWATLAGWSYGASLVMDYLETDLDIDRTNVAIMGHSRDGKTALWTGALDKRYKLIISNSSGLGGAAYTRGKKGEHLKDINVSDWFCENYRKYNDREDLLPVDQHMLLAAIAPRPLYVKSDVLDEWSDPAAELLAAQLASPAFELYGVPGVIAKEEEIELDTPYHEGRIAYHRSNCDHDLTTFDWKLYMDFADKYLK